MGQTVGERSLRSCLEFLLCNECSFIGSDIRNVWLLWLEANSLFAEICVLMLLMFSFHSLIRAIKEIVFLAGSNSCRMRTSGNLNFCHSTAVGRRGPGWLFPAGMGGEANLAVRSLLRGLLCCWSCSLRCGGLFTPGASPVPLTAWVQLRFGCMSVLQSGVDYSLENIPTLTMNKLAQIRIVLEKRHCGLVF